MRANATALRESVDREDEFKRRADALWHKAIKEHRQDLIGPAWRWDEAAILERWSYQRICALQEQLADPRPGQPPGSKDSGL